MAQQNFAGIWRSRYVYTSSSRDGEFVGEHLVRAHQKDNHVVFESVPGSTSYLLVRLTVHDDIATGSWQEETEPEGYYKGAIYSGAIQLSLDKDGKACSGKWLGAGKDRNVNSGRWDFEYVGQDVAAAA